MKIGLLLSTVVFVLVGGIEVSAASDKVAFDEATNALREVADSLFKEAQQQGKEEKVYEMQTELRKIFVASALRECSSEADLDNAKLRELVEPAKELMVEAENLLEQDSPEKFEELCERGAKLAAEVRKAGRGALDESEEPSLAETEGQKAGGSGGDGCSVQ